LVMLRGSDSTCALICIGLYVVLHEPSVVSTAAADGLEKHVLRSFDISTVSGAGRVGCSSARVTRDCIGGDEITDVVSVTA